MRQRVHGYQAWVPTGAPWGVHYEVVRHKNAAPTLEIHIEDSAFVERVQPILRGWATSLAGEFVHAELDFDPRWSGKKGRLRLSYSDGVDPAMLRDDFLKLVSLTRNELWPSVDDESTSAST